MKPFTHLLLLLLSVSAFLSPVWAGDETDTSEPQSYTYRIPFPEANYFGVWRFRLELISLSGEDFQASLVGYNEDGGVSFRHEELSIAGASQLRWDSINKTAAPLQALTVVSTKELTGALWLWDGSVFNGVSLNTESAPQLLMTHIPAEDFNWRTQFAVTGYSEPNFTTDIIFGYYDYLGNYEEQVAWYGLGNLAYYQAAPFLDIPLGNLGEESNIRWAKLRSTFDEFNLTGYQTLIREDFATAGIQSCATEMSTQGAASGWVGFSQVEGLINWFVLTNPSETEAVQLNLALNQRVTREARDGEPSHDPQGQPLVYTDMQTLPVSLLLAPKQSVKHTLGELFGAYSGTPVSMHYKATTIPVASSDDSEVVVEPRPILALYVQENATRTAMAGANFVAQDGGRASHWLNRDLEYAVSLETFNTRNRFQKLDMTVLHPNGDVLVQTSLEVPPLETVRMTSDEVFERARIALANRDAEEDRETPTLMPNELRVNFSLESDGSFITKITATQPNDFAVVNGHMLPRVTNVETRR